MENLASTTASLVGSHLKLKISTAATIGLPSPLYLSLTLLAPWRVTVAEEQSAMFPMCQYRPPSRLTQFRKRTVSSNIPPITGDMERASYIHIFGLGYDIAS